MEAAELNEQLDQIGVAAMEFKRAANNNRESMSNIVRDISSYFQSQNITVTGSSETIISDTSHQRAKSLETAGTYTSLKLFR